MSIFEDQTYLCAYHPDKPGNAPRAHREKIIEAKRGGQDYAPGPATVANEFLDTLPRGYTDGLIVLVNLDSKATYVYHIEEQVVTRPTTIRVATDASGKPCDHTRYT